MTADNRRVAIDVPSVPVTQRPRAARAAGRAAFLRIHRAVYAGLTGGSALALIVAAVGGFIWLAAIALGIALANEALAVFSKPQFEEALRRAGLRGPTRALLRSLMVALAVGVATGDESAPLILYGFAATCAHVLGIACNTLTGWVVAQAPAFGVRNVGTGLELADAFVALQQTRESQRYLVLTGEWVVLLGLAIEVDMEGSLSSYLVVTAAGVAVMLAMSLKIARRARRLVTGGRVAEYQRRLHEELERYEPEAIVYMSAAAGQSGYMLNQWLPALNAMQKHALILVREAGNVAPIGETTLPIVLAPATRDVERLVLPSVKMAVYVANAGRNVHLLREPGIKHVFLNHGDSDKATSANPVTRVYDEVWVAGQAAIDRYDAAGVHIPRERFAIVGRPQTHRLPVGPRADSSPTRVLYAPTWEGIYEEVNYSSLEEGGPQIVQTILERCPDVGIVFKPHPATGAWRAGMTDARRKVERILADAPHAERHMAVCTETGMTLNDCFALADVLISDISSVVTDFLHTERPIVVTNPIGLDREAFNAMFPTQTASYILGPPYEDVVAMLDLALGTDPLATARVEMKRRVLGDLPAGPMAAFAENVDRVCKAAVDDRAQLRNDFMFSALAVAARRSPHAASVVEALRKWL